MFQYCLKHCLLKLLKNQEKKKGIIQCDMCNDFFWSSIKITLWLFFSSSSKCLALGLCTVVLYIVASKSKIFVVNEKKMHIQTQTSAI